MCSTPSCRWTFPADAPHWRALRYAAMASRGSSAFLNAPARASHASAERGSHCASSRRAAAAPRKSPCVSAARAALSKDSLRAALEPKRVFSTGRSQSRAADFAAECGEPPARGLRVEAEADMARKGVCVAEDALQRIGLVDAVGAGHRVQRVYRLGGEAHRVGEIALEAELRGDVGDLPAAGDLLRLEAVVAQDQVRGVDLRP